MRCNLDATSRYTCPLCHRTCVVCAAHLQGINSQMLCDCKAVPVRTVLPPPVAQVQDPRVRAVKAQLKQARVSGATETVNVGVAFRTDSLGSVHLTHDMAGITALNQMLTAEGAKLFPFTVVPVALPRGASGAITPVRNARWTDLDGIHLLYIPGSAVANDTQEGSSPVTAGGLRAEEEGLARLVQPVRARKEGDGSYLPRVDKYLRAHGEHVSRAAYELRLLGIARARGIPVLAVCAGSWRLLESYGGKVRTLEIVPRARHKSTNTSPAAVWGLENQIRLVGGKTLIKLMENLGHQERHLTQVSHRITVTSPEGVTKTLVGDGVHGLNSTHWAVASTARVTPRITVTDTDGDTRTLVQSTMALADGAGTPSDLLEISAIDPDTDTVEAFESLYGAPTMGIQWHPEGYLPGMPGEHSGTEEAQVLSKALFELMAYSGQTVKRRQEVIGSLNLEGQAFDLLCDSARQMALHKQVGAGNLYIGATSVLPARLWSGRMLAVDSAIDLLGESDRVMEEGRPLAAAALFTDAKRMLAEYGVII